MKPSLKAVEVALENELGEKEFYLKQSHKVTNPVGKKMFETIAQEEEEHHQQLLEIHKKLEATGQWPEHVSTVVDETHVREALKEMIATTAGGATSTTDDKQAIEIAIEFEKKAHLFYKELIKKTDNTEERKFFEYMAAIEHRHVVSLEDTLLYMEDPSGWMMAAEKSLLDG
ncbi:ferritin family protein [bacterium]|nr:ferritin family protein [bacterium]